MTHTPGPWNIHEHLDGTVGIVSDDGKSIAKVWDYPEALANARLIAAAPQLLDALQQLVTYLDDYPPDFYNPEKGQVASYDFCHKLGQAAIAAAGEA